jgi:hypothetical protein
MSDRDAAIEWVKRVLGVDVAGPGTGLSEGLVRSAERGREAKASNARGIAYPKMLLRWRTAQSEAVGALDRIGKAYLAMPNVQADPRYARVQTAIAKLPALIPNLGDELSDLLDRGINAGSDAGIAKEALAVVGQYRQSITGAATLGAFEQFAKKYVGDLAVVRTLDGALAEIAQNLESAL